MRRRRVVSPSFDRSAFAGFRFPAEVILLAVRWYLRYGLSYRDVEELLAERGIEVDAIGTRVQLDGVDQLWDRTGYGTLISTNAGDNFVHLPGGGVLRDDTDWLLRDGVGSVRQATDTTGAVYASSAFTAFGEPRTTVSSVFGFAGEQTDPNGLVHLRARGYNPALGTFTAFDPVQPGGPSTAGWNHYTYSANNPTTWSDPTGTAVLKNYSALLSRALENGAPLATFVGFGVGAMAGFIGCGGIKPTVDAAEYALCVGISMVCTSAAFTLGTGKPWLTAIFVSGAMGAACQPVAALIAGGSPSGADISVGVAAALIGFEAAAAGWLDITYMNATGRGVARKGKLYDPTTLALHVMAVSAFTGIVAAVLARVATELAKTPTATSSGERELE